MNIINILARINYDTSLKNPMFDIYFENNGADCTEFTVHKPKNLKQIKQELCELWRDFCKENGLNENCITDVICVGNDPYEDA